MDQGAPSPDSVPSRRAGQNCQARAIFVQPSRCRPTRVHAMAFSVGRVATSVAGEQWRQDNRKLTAAQVCDGVARKRLETNPFATCSRLPLAIHFRHDMDERQRDREGDQAEQDRSEVHSCLLGDRGNAPVCNANTRPRARGRMPGDQRQWSRDQRRPLDALASSVAVGCLEMSKSAGHPGVESTRLGGDGQRVVERL